MIEAIDVFNQILLQEVEDGSTNGDYVDTADFEAYISFFDGIPDANKKEVLEDFLVLVYEYQRVTTTELDRVLKAKAAFEGHTPKLIELVNFINKPRKPQREIDKDLSTLREYVAMIKRLYGGTDGKHLFNVPEDIRLALTTTKKMIADLEAKHFQIISRAKYYNPTDTTKTELKAFLKDTRIKYNLNANDAKQLLDAI